MPESRYARAQQIVHAAFEVPEAQRAAYVARQCGGDSGLHDEVRWLLDAVQDAALDEVPAALSSATEALNADLRLQGCTPGQYRLIEPIGEGGMGVVWLAEREVGGACQRVALKRLHSGAMAHQSRLREEQRILASLTHPNIARLLDAGEDAAGMPYLAMEWVAGERIDHWCFRRNLDLRARLELFLKTCAAVSCAHQQLIIHRDLKPANVLVDASGEPKLLDFGIARLLNAEAAGRTATRLMTPAYASPEQLAGKPLGTGTDVWSLGVMLYELLSGSHPYAHVEGELARAQAVLSGTVTAPSHIAAAPPAPSSAADPASRPVRIPRDVDAIILKAMRCEPGQRYASVQEFADDLRRFLAAQPVQARRGRWGYAAQRFVQRNRWSLAATAALSLTVAGFTWHTVLTEREARRQAEIAARTTEFLVSTFALSDPTQNTRHDFSAREVLDRGRERVERELQAQPQVRARLLEALGEAYRGINEGTAGAPLLEAAAQLNLDPAVDDPLAAARSLRAKAASLRVSNGSTLEAEDAAQRAFVLVRTHAQDQPLVMAEAYSALALALDGVGKESQAIPAARRALALRETGGASPLVLARSLVELCAVLSGANHQAEAQRHCERALEAYDAAGAAQTNDYRVALRHLEKALVYSGQYERGLEVARRRLALTAALFGEQSSVLAAERVAMTDRLAEQGLFAEAENLLELGLPVILARNGAHSSQYAKALFHQGWTSYLQGRYGQALPLLRRALEVHAARVDGQDRGMLLVLRTTLAQVLVESGQANAEARSLLESVITERSEGDALPSGLAYARLPLAQWHAARGDISAARVLLDQVEAVGSGVEQELHARVAATRALLLTREGDHLGALAQARQAFDIMRADRGPASPRTVRYALACARAARAAGAEPVAREIEAEYQPRLVTLYPADSVFLTHLTAPR